MLTQPTIEKLKVMKLTAMAQAFTEQTQRPDMASITFEERFGLLVDHQMTELENHLRHSTMRCKTLR